MTYESKAGDPRRQGRNPAPRRDVAQFADKGSRVLVMLGAVPVGEITINPAGGRHEFLWRVWLPMCPAVHAKASDLDAAKRGALHKVIEWIEAAGLKTRSG